MTRWFGPTWHAPVNVDGEEVPVPVGKSCIECEAQFKPEQRGLCIPWALLDAYLLPSQKVVISDHMHVAYHLSCFLREVVGRDVTVGEMLPSQREGAAAVARRRLAERKDTP